MEIARFGRRRAYVTYHPIDAWLPTVDARIGIDYIERLCRAAKSRRCPGPWIVGRPDEQFLNFAYKQPYSRLRVAGSRGSVGRTSASATCERFVRTYVTKLIRNRVSKQTVKRGPHGGWRIPTGNPVPQSLARRLYDPRRGGAESGLRLHRRSDSGHDGCPAGCR